MNAQQIAEQIRQGYRDGSIARKASTMIRERGMEREDAEREILAEMIGQLNLCD